MDVVYTELSLPLNKYINSLDHVKRSECLRGGRAYTGTLTRTMTQSSYRSCKHNASSSSNRKVIQHWRMCQLLFTTRSVSSPASRQLASALTCVGM